MTLDRTNRALIGTALALALLVGLRLLEQSLLPPDRLEFPGVASPSVLAITITTARERVRLERDGRVRHDAAAEETGAENTTDSWLIVGQDGPALPADAARVDALLAFWRAPRTTGAAVFARGDGDALRQLGFGPAQVVDLELEGEGGLLLLSVEFGAESRGGRLVRRDRDRGAYPMAYPGFERLLAPIESWRGERQAPRRPATRVTIEGPDGRLTLEQHEGAWRASEPAGFQLSAHALRRVVSAAEALSSLPILAPEERPASAETAPRPWRVGVRDADGPFAVYSLGAPSNGVVLAVTDGGVVRRGPEETLAPLLLPTSALADTQLFDLRWTDGASISVRRGGRTLRLERAQGAWTQTPPGPDARQLPVELAVLHAVGLRSEATDLGDDTLDVAVETDGNSHHLRVAGTAAGDVYEATCDGRPITLRSTLVDRWRSLLEE